MKVSLLMNPTFSHVLMDRTLGLFTINCFEDSKHTYLFNVENAVQKEN